jgi:hypothetical protein
MTALQLISQAKNDTDSSNAIPAVEMLVSKGLGTPGDLAASKVVTLSLKSENGKVDKNRLTLELKDTNLVNLVNVLNPPPWKLTVSLFNTAKVMSGDRVYINAFLSFNRIIYDAAVAEAPPTVQRIPAGEIYDGDWLFPIIVTDGTNDYLLAQVHVQIKAETPKPSATDDSSNKTAAAKTAAGKDAVAKLSVEISLPKLSVEVSTLKPADKSLS